MKIVSLFSGAGGLDLGLKWAGLNIIFANDVEKDACATYKRHIGDHIVHGDINKLIDQLPQADILVGGPPCQSFSLVGKRKKDDPRGELVFSYLKAVKQVNPSVFVMENVPGLMASKLNDIKLVEFLKKEFEDLGYEVEILKIDASEYFVPQKRKRVFMIGQKGKNTIDLQKGKKIVSEKINLGFDEVINVGVALDDLPNAVGKKESDPSYSTVHNHAYTRFMRKHNNKTISFQNMPTMSDKDKAFIKHIPPGGNYTHIPDNISTQRIMNFKKTGGRTTTYGRLHPDKPAYTINTYFNRPNVGANYHHSEERLITVREAMRLQSFPDEFEPVFSNQRSLHMQIGNAVPPVLGWVLGEAIKLAIKTN